MLYLLYLLWLSLPLFFFGFALWGKLEAISNKDKHENSGDFFRQGVFVSLCVGLAVLIDKFALESFVENYSPEFMPLGFWQVILLPAILVLGAKLIGPTKAIRPGRRKVAAPAKPKPRKR